MAQQDQKASGSFEAPQQNRNTKRAPKPTNHQFREEIRTLFVRGLPSDIREREIHNLFRFFFGYEGCILNENSSKQVQPVAFVSFTERECALRAMRYLQDVRLDLNSPQTLRIDFAKSNSKTKRLSPNDLFPPEQRRIAPPLVSNPYYPPPFTQYNAPNYGINPIHSLIPWLRQTNLNTNPVHIAPTYNSSTYPAPTSKVPPCSTLFVANIHPEVPERDLVRLFRTCPGFQKLKMSQKDGAPICFAEFSDVTASSNAMQTFQGFLVGPAQLRIEFARARMGESRRQRENLTEEQTQDGPKKQGKGNRSYSDVAAPSPPSPPQAHSLMPTEDDNDDRTNDFDQLVGNEVVGTNRNFSQQ